MNPQPPSPASRHPARASSLRVGQTVGLAAAALEAALGRPDSRRAGRCWLAPPGSAQPHLERDAGGTLRPAAVFGPVPTRIPAGTAYEEWVYRNVGGMTWVLYLASAEPGSPLAVCEARQYPEGAVF